MDDARVWTFEEGLWTGDVAHYRELIDSQCLMVLPQAPFVSTGAQSIDAVSRTPRWSSVVLSDQQISRPEEGLIVVAYKVEAHRHGADDYVAYCTSTYRRLARQEWRVIQHQQTPSPLEVNAK